MRSEWHPRRPAPLVQRFLLLLSAFFGAAVSVAKGQCSQGKIQGPAIIKGGKFFDSVSGEYFPIKGINYYPRPNAGPLIGNNIDFFTEEYKHIWERDIPEFVSLGINTIRLFAVDPSANHDAFFCALRNAGIRVIVGLSANCKDCSITTEQAPLCYPPSLKTRGQFIIAEFSKYDNVFGFSVSNEIGLQVIGAPEINAPCAKQFIRDMRAFIQSCPTMRKIPVGLATADRDRRENALYYNCRSDPDDELENVEWYGINAYQHCDGTDRTVEELNGFLRLRSDFSSYGLSVPVVLTEFGCINPSFPTIDGFEAQRNFLQIEALFSEPYVQHFAGGCVFEYSNEDRKTPSPWPYMTYFRQGNFGVGYFSPEFCDDIDIRCEYVHFPQFDLLASAFGRVDVSFIPAIDDFVHTVPTMTPVCPLQFPSLASFTWKSSMVENWKCPDPITIDCTTFCPLDDRPIELFPVSVAPKSSPTDIPLDSPVNTAAPEPSISSKFTRSPTDGSVGVSSSSNITLPSRVCSAHQGCSNLAGNCCPTDTNVLLSCYGQVEASCWRNPFCHSLDLVGECCPTTRGVYLDCCAILPGNCYGLGENFSTSCIVYSALQYKQDLNDSSALSSPGFDNAASQSHSTRLSWDANLVVAIAVLLL